MRIPLSAPDISEGDIDAVLSVLRTPRLSLGPKMEDFEQAVSQYVGVPYGVAVASGTAGLHLGLRALGIGEGDEVILPSFTFIAVAHAVLYERAVPVFVDIDPVTLNLDPACVAEAITPRTRAILAVHTFGCPADLDPILEIAERHGLRVVEDACEAIGAEYRGRKVGGFGDLGVFSFYPNKPITTGEGGMIVTRDRALAETLRAMRNQGRSPEDGRLDRPLLGFNYRLSEINSALGVSQMQRLDRILACRQARAARYAEELRAIPEITLPALTVPRGRQCWFVFVVRLAARFQAADRDAVLRYMAERGIGCASYFAPVHQQPLYAACHGLRHDLPITEQCAQQTLALPFFNRLKDEQIAEVCETLREAIRRV